MNLAFYYVLTHLKSTYCPVDNCIQLKLRLITSISTDSILPALNTTTKYLSEEVHSVLTEPSCINLDVGPTPEHANFEQLTINVILT